jgi:hypothetical protein
VVHRARRGVSVLESERAARWVPFLQAAKTYLGGLPMNVLGKKSFVSIASLVSFAMAAAVVTACDDDNGSSAGNDAGSGGSTSGTGGRNGSGATASGGRSSGGTSSGGSGATGTGGLLVTTEGGVVVRDGGRDSGDAATDGGDAGAAVQLRFVHAAPGAGPVDVYVTGIDKPIATNVTYGSATPYVSIDGGSHTFDLRAAGATANATPLFTTPAIDVVAGTRYTAVAEGNIASTAAADGFRVAAYPELFAPATTGKARIRIVHAAYDGPTVNLDIGNDDPSAPEVNGLKPFDDTGPTGVEVDAGTAVQVGVVVNKAALTAFTTPKLDEKTDAFVVATGLTSKLSRDPLGLAALVVLPDSSTLLVRQNPRLYVLHASTDAGAVDVFNGNKEVIDDVSYGSLSLVQVPPGAVTLDLFAGATGPTTRPVGAPAASVISPVLEAGNNYLGVLAGTITTSTKTLGLKTFAEGFDLTKASQSLLRAVHASSDTAGVDVGLVTTAGTLDTPPAFAGLGFGDASAAAGTAVPVGAETLGAAATGTTSTLAEFGVTTTAGQRAFAVIGGSSAGGAHPLGLFVVDTVGVFWSVHAIAQK